MGTELLRHGADPGSCLERLSLDRPELVLAIHCAYRAAGADLLTTNTIGANRFRLRAFGLERSVDLINRAAVSLARTAAHGATIAGSIGPSGERDRLPHDTELRAGFGEQAESLAAAGVDIFLCETFGDLHELRTAIQAIRAVAPLPILATMTYCDDGRTPLGLRPRQVADGLHDLGLAGIGANCCIGDTTVLGVIDALRQATSLPLVGRPNAGQPVMVGASLRYPLGPEQFGEMARCLSEKSSIVGGCCGTTPDHIAAARRLFDQPQSDA